MFLLELKSLNIEWISSYYFYTSLDVLTKELYARMKKNLNHKFLATSEEDFKRSIIIGGLPINKEIHFSLKFTIHLVTVDGPVNISI